MSNPESEPRKQETTPEPDAPSAVEASGEQSEDFAALDELEEMEPERRSALIRSLSVYYGGPLPAPAVLREYKAIDPQAPDWVFESATKEQDHRHWCDKEPLKQSRRGQTFAFIIALLVIAIGAILIFLDKSTEGLATILVPLAIMLGVFVYSQVQESKARHAIVESNEDDGKKAT